MSNSPDVQELRPLGKGMARVPCHRHGDVSTVPPGPGKGMRAGVAACVCVGSRFCRNGRDSQGTSSACLPGLWCTVLGVELRR